MALVHKASLGSRFAYAKQIDVAKCTELEPTWRRVAVNRKGVKALRKWLVEEFA